MNILILKAKKQLGDDDLLSNFNKYGVTTGNRYSIGYLVDIIFDFTKNVSVTIYGKNILTYDYFYFRSWEKNRPAATTLAKFLLSKSKKFIDTSVGIYTFGSKIYQTYLLVVNNLPVPKCYVVNRNLLSNNLKFFVKSLKGYPVVLKVVNSSEGKGVYLLKSYEDFRLIENELTEDHYFVQEFIPNDFDYRFVVFGNKVSVIKKRTRAKNTGEFRNNVALGATVEHIDPSTMIDMCNLAVKAAKVRDLEVAGVDIVISKLDGKPYIFEVNPAPSFKNDFTVLKYLDGYFNNL